MPYCDRMEAVDGKLVAACRRGDKSEDRWIEERGRPHIFSGYGWIANFHPECCPRTLDGSDCDLEHPQETR